MAKKMGIVRQYRDRVDGQLGDIMGQIRGSKPNRDKPPKKQEEAEEKLPKKGSWW